MTKVFGNVLLTAAAGLVVGAIFVGVGGRDTKWLLAIVGLIAGAAIFLGASGRSQIAIGFLLFASQFDAQLYLFYGRAGTSGIGIGVVLLGGLLLLAAQRFNGERALAPMGELETWTLLLLVAMIIWGLVSATLSAEKFAGLSRLVEWGHYSLLFYVGGRLPRYGYPVRRVVHFGMWLVILQSAIALLQWRFGVTFTALGAIAHTGHGIRPGGTISTNPAGFGSFVLPYVTASMAVVVGGLGKGRMLSWTALVFGLAAVAIGFTRSVWIAIAFGVVCVGALAIRWRMLSWGRILLVGAGLMSLVPLLVPLLLQRVEGDYGAEGNTLDERLALLMLGLKVFSEHPVLGVGPGAYPFLFKSYVDQNTGELWLSTVHNEFVLRAAETGFVGLALFCAALWLVIRASWLLIRLLSPAEKQLAIGIFAGLIGVVWIMLWVPWTGFGYNCAFWLLCGAVVGQLTVERHGVLVTKGI